MKKLIGLLLLLSPLVYAGATRYIDADAVKSSDHTKTWTMPNQSDTLTGQTTSDVLTNKSMSGSSNTFTNIPASTALTGVVPVANGGTNSSSTLKNGRVIISSGSTIGEMSLPGASGQILTSNGASNPSWQTNAPSATNITGTLTYDHGGTGQSSVFTQYGPFYANTTSTMAQVTPTGGNSGYLLTSNGTIGAPSYQQWNYATSGGTGNLPVTNGGTNTGSALAGNRIIVSSGGTIGELSLGGISGYGLVSNGSSLPTWQNLSLTYLPLAGGTMSGAITMGSNQIHTVTDPTSNQDAATKSYVDTQLLQLNPAAAVYAGSTIAIAGTYTNAVGGVCIGDTFQGTATVNPFTLDGQTPAIGARLLFKDQTSSFQDGVWTLTTQAVGGVSGAIFTRALDFDSSADINAGQIVPIVNGTTNAGSSWYQTATNTTCNTSTQTWTQFQKSSSAYVTSVSATSPITSSGGNTPVISTSVGSYTVLNNNNGYTSAVSAGQTIVLGTPAFSDSGALFQITGNSNSYQQGVVQNTNNGTVASSDFIVANDSATATTFYGDFGINSSGFTGSGSLNKPNATYLYGQSGDLVLATKGINNIHMLVNSGSTDALIVDTSNKLIFPGMTGYLYGNGSNEITSATTVPFSSITGTVPIAQGGTNSAIALNNNRVIVSSGGTLAELNFTGTSGQALVSNGTSSLPTWQTILANPMTTKGDIIYSSDGSGTSARLAIGVGGSILTVANGLPSWGGLGSNYFYSSSQVSNNSSDVTSVCPSFTTFSNSPAFTFVPTVTGTYIVYSSAPIYQGTGSIQSYAKIINTTGGATLLNASVVTNFGPTTSFLSSMYIQSVYTLNAGTSYVFDIQGCNSSAGTEELLGTSSPFYMFAQLIQSLNVGTGGTLATVTSNVNMASGVTYLADTTSGSLTLKMPTPASGAIVYLKDPKGKWGLNKLSISRNGSEKIDQIPATKVLAGSSMSVAYVSDGTDWFSMNKPEYMSARYHGTTTVPTSALGTVLFTTTDYDLNANCPNGVCTIVSPGTYHVGAGLLTTAATVAVSTTISINILKNGTVYSQRDSWPYTAAASKPASATIDDDVQLTTGDTVAIQMSSNGTTPTITNTASKNYFYIRRVGD